MSSTHTARTSRPVPGLCTQQHARGVKPSFIMFVMSAEHTREYDEYAIIDGTQTVVEDIKHLGSTILCNAGK